MSSFPLFILGTQRGMTSFVLNCVRKAPGIRLLNEPLAGHVALFREEDLRPYDESILSRPAELPSDFVDYVQEFRRWCIATDEIRGCKEVLLLNKIPWVHSNFPRARIILLWRDPRGVVEALIRRRLDVRWNYRSILRTQAPLLYDQCKDATREEIAATIWTLRVQQAISLHERTPVGMLSVRVEDLMANPLRELSHMMNFLGVAEPHPEQVDYLVTRCSGARGQTFSDYHEKGWLNEWQKRLDHSTVERITRLTSKELVRLGYQI